MSRTWTWFNAVAMMVVVLLGEVVVVPARAATANKKFCPTGLANFGDSLTDTGNALSAFPYMADAENPPYGETFFGQPAKRFCNGRVVPDFFSLAFRWPLLDAYFATTNFDYKHGVNFAVAGATAAPLATAIVPFSVNPYQTAQFIRLKNSAKKNTLEGQAECGNFFRDLPIGNPYSDWLYTIEAGGNDILHKIENNVSFSVIVSQTIPESLGNISLAIQTLYAHSATKFLVFNIPPPGCSTIIFTMFAGLGLPTDSLGCIANINEIVSAFNTGLNETVQGLRKSLPGVTISLFDYYSANLEILEHPTTYGFNPNLTFTACCGAPGMGTLNYNLNVTCGHPQLGSNVCANPEEYVNWDGVHYTDHFYRIIAKFALSGKFTDEGFNYTAHCNLDFSKFGPKVTFKEAYPLQCNDLSG